MNKKGKVTVGILSSVLLITPITAVINSNEAYARNTSVNAGGVQISQRDMEIFQRELKKELMKDPAFAKEVTQEEFGVKTKVAKYAAKAMLRKLYKVGSRSFDRAVVRAANKIPNKRVRDFIVRNVKYSTVSNILNEATKFEDNIENFITNRLQRIGLGRSSALILSKSIVWFLL